jgi:hypothetical protein
MAWANHPSERIEKQKISAKPAGKKAARTKRTRLFPAFRQELTFNLQARQPLPQLVSRPVDARLDRFD